MKKSIKFTSDEYRTLLELIYLGEHVVNGHKVDRIERYRQLCKYLFSLTKLFNLNRISDEDEPQFPSGDFEELMRAEFLDEYDELTFWDELAERLTGAVFYERYSKEEIEAMNREKRGVILCRLRDEVDDYLRIKGLDDFPLHNFNTTI